MLGNAVLELMATVICEFGVSHFNQVLQCDQSPITISQQSELTLSLLIMGVVTELKVLATDDFLISVIIACRL